MHAPEDSVYLPERLIQTPTVWIFDAVDDRLIGRVVVPRSDLQAVDAVARICLAAKQQGLSPALRGTTPEFYALLDLAGLTTALGAGPAAAPDRSAPPTG